MSQDPQTNKEGRSTYAAPVLRRLGTVAELTENRTPQGGKDGGPNNTRTQ